MQKKSKKSDGKNLSNLQKINRQLILSINMFLLRQDSMKECFWEVKSVDYKHAMQIVKIGIETTTGKHGTTLAKLRKLSKLLSDYLFEYALTFRRAKVEFFVDKEQEQIKRIYSIIEKVEIQK